MHEYFELLVNHIFCFELNLTDHQIAFTAIPNFKKTIKVIVKTFFGAAQISNRGSEDHPPSIAEEDVSPAETPKTSQLSFRSHYDSNCRRELSEKTF